MTMRDIFEELKDIKCYEDSTTVTVGSRYYYELLNKLDEILQKEERQLELMYEEYLNQTQLPF